MKKFFQNKKRFTVLAVAAVLILSGLAFGVCKYKLAAENKKQLYEALTEMRGEEAGDAIAVLPAGHQWSETERTSYLILKIRLTPEDAAKLTQPETREAKPPLGSEASKDEKRDMGPQLETVRARAYRLKIETLDFNLDEIWKGQPYADKVFDEDLIQKK